MQSNRFSNIRGQHRREMKGQPKSYERSIPHLLNCYSQVNNPDQRLQRLIIAAVASQSPEVKELAFSAVWKSLAYDSITGYPFRHPSSNVSDVNSEGQHVFLGEIQNDNKRPFLVLPH